MAYTRYGAASGTNTFTGSAFVALNTHEGGTTTAADTTKYIPTLYAGKLLVKFYETSVLGNIANTDYEGEIRNQGDAVIIRKLPTLNIADHSKGLKLSHQNPEVDSVTLEINKGKYWAFVTDDVDDIQTDIKNWISEWTQDAAYELRNKVEQDVLQNVAGDAGVTFTGSGSAVGTPIFLGATGVDVVDTIIDAGSKLDENNVPDDGRFFLLPPAIIGMIKKSELGDANKSGDNVSIKRNGVVGMIDRFTIYRTNNLTTTTSGGSGDDKVTTCLFGHKAGITFATQLLKNEMIPNPDGFGMLHRGLQVYGFKVVKPEALGAVFLSAEQD